MDRNNSNCVSAVIMSGVVFQICTMVGCRCTCEAEGMSTDYFYAADMYVFLV